MGGRHKTSHTVIKILGFPIIYYGQAHYATVDGSDYFPDISMGRLSVDTSAQADKRVNDIIRYEKAVVTDSSFYTKAALCGYFQHAGGGFAERRFAQRGTTISH